MSSRAEAFLLEDLPASAFQVVLKHLRGPDVASLRLVNRCISGHAAAAPYITLRLSGSTSREQLRAWARATCRLQHTPSIHLICCGRIRPAVFDAALELLALRGNVRELHLLGAPGSAPASAPHAASLPTMEPLNRLKPWLRTLIISDLALADLAGDVARLVAVGQLQELRLQHVAWGPSGSCSLSSFAAAMRQLPASFPKLQQLALQLPSITPQPPVAAGVVGALAGSVSSAATAAALRQQQAAALVAAVSAVAQLQQLQCLELSRAPDIWAADGSSPTPTAAAAEDTAAAAAVALAAAAMAAGAVAGSSTGGTAAPPLALPAASCLTSLDALGSWLLLRMPQLQRLCIESSGANWTLTWDHLHQHVSSSGSASSGAGRSGSSSSSDSSRPALVSTPVPCIKATYHAGMPARQVSTSSSIRSHSTQQSLAAGFARQLARYSPRHTCTLLPHISTLQLAIQGDQLRELRPLLASLPGLHTLKVTLLTTSSQTADLAALVAAAAAAGTGRLRSLVLLPGMGEAEVGAGTLLPLTAAAGGPGSSLRQLRLVGCFKPAAAAAAAGNVPCAKDTSAAAAAAAAWSVLRQLDGLHELCIHQLGPEKLQLPVSCLPASLEVLEGRRLHLSNSSSSSSDNHAAAAAPALRALHLQHSQLDDAGGLASSRLQQLTAAASSWPGGWQAAAATWPGLRDLTAWCRDTQRMQAGSTVAGGSSSGSGGSGGRSQARQQGVGEARAQDSPAAAQTAAAAWAAGPAAEASEQLMLQLARGFGRLQSVHVQHLPCLSPGVLRAARCMMPQLQHLRLLCTAAAGASEELLAAAAGGAGKNSSDGALCALKSLVLHVPAGRMPSAGVAAVAPAPAAVAASAAAAAAAEGAAASQEAGGSSGAATWVDLQQAVLQHMPWACVSVVADQCLQ